MTTESTSVDTENTTVDLQKNEWVTVREAIIREGVSEKSIYNRINSGYYLSRMENGKKYVLIQKRSEATEPTHLASEFIQEESIRLTEYLQNRVQELAEENSELKLKLSEALKNISEAENRASRLEGELKGKDSVIQTKDEVIQAKDQAINAANAAVILMEQQKQTLDAITPKQLETALKKPWWRFGI